MKKIWIWLSMIGLLLSVSPVFAAPKFNERLYCKATANSVRIYLFAEKETFKCSQYLQAINKNLRDEYESLSQVIAMLNRGDDYAYRKELFDSKKQSFLKLFALLKKIENAISEFQTGFLEKSQKFVAPSLEQHLKQLQMQKEDLTNQLAVWHDFWVEKELNTTQLTMQTINVLLQTKDIDAFLQALDRYLSSAKL